MEPTDPIQHQPSASAAECLLALQWCPAFASLSPAELRPLARHSRVISVPEGARLFAPGDDPTALYVVESGSMELAGSAGNDRIPISLVGPGDLVGTAVAGGGALNAFAVATAPARLVAMPRPMVDRFLDRYPRTREHILTLFHRRQGLYRDAKRAERQATSGLGQTIAVHSPKGGAGTTTVALALAATLGEIHPGRVVLADLAVPFNHAAAVTGTVPTTSVARVGQLRPDQFDDALVSGIAPFGDIGLVSGALGPAEADLITPTLVEQLVAVLRREFRFVVIDAGASRSIGLSVLRRAERPILVVSPELPALNEILRLRSALPELARAGVLLNHPRPAAWIKRRAAEDVLAAPVVVEVPFDKRIHQDMARRRLTMRAAAGSRVARAARTAVEDLVVDRRRQDAKASHGHHRWTIS